MRGFTLIEIMVALALLSFAAMGLANCLVTAQRAQVESGRWMRAFSLAEESIERARVSGCGAADVVDAYSRTCTASGSGLERIEVAVSWSLPVRREVRLATMVRR